MDVTVLDSTIDAILVVDQNWQVRSCNQAAQHLLHLPTLIDTMIPLWRHVPQWIGTVFEQEFRAVMAHHHTVHFEAFSPLGNCWLETTITPQAEVMVICLRDISERKQIEADVLARSLLASLVSRVSRFVMHSHQVGECLQYCTDALIEELNSAIAAIWLYNAQHDHLERQALTMNPTVEPLMQDLSVFQTNPLPLMGSIIGTIGVTQKPIRNLVFSLGGNPSTDGAIDLPIAATQREAEQLFCAMESFGLTAPPKKLFLTGYPLVLDEQLIGVMALWTQYPLPQSIEEGLAMLGDHLVLDIDRCWAKNALGSRREALLFRLANQMRNSLDLNTILETAVQEIRTLLDVDCCSYLWCWSEQDTTMMMVSHEAIATPTIQPFSATITASQQQFFVQQIAHQHILRVDSVRASNLSSQVVWDSLLDALAVHSLLLLPLQTRSSHLGAVVCIHRQDVRHWSDSEVDLLQAVVNQLALAIDQAELFAQARAAALAAQTQAQQLELTLQELRRTQAQLVQTEKMSSLGQMVAGIAHEINNPVNFISGNLSYTDDYVNDLLRLLKAYKAKVPDDPELQELAEEVDLDFILEDLPKTLSSMQVGAERIRQIVLSLRNFSRLDQAEMKPVDIHEGIDNTLLILQNRLKAKGKRPEIKVERNYGHLPLVHCYAGQLNQVFMNILANAIDAFEDQPEPQQLTITTALLGLNGELIPNPPPDEEAGKLLEWEDCSGSVLIQIADNGMGMPEKTVSNIFDPFFTTKPVGKGTGLGLAISYQIVVEKHHGTIDCQSTPGEGTQFKIKIPLCPPEA